MKYPTLTRTQLAELRGVKPETVSKQRLPKTTDGRYSLKNKDVRDWFMQPFKTEWENAHRRKQKDLPEGDGSLDDEKLKADIMLKEKQGRKLDLEFERLKKDLIPSQLMAIWIGYFAQGVSTYFLPIGARIGRDDVTLRNRVEKEIKKSIEKTIEAAERGLREEGGKIAEALEHHE